MPEAIIAAWGPMLTQMPVAAACNIHLSETERRILVEVGLPSAAAPFLTFVETGSTSLLSPDDLLQSTTSHSDLIVLGSTGSGDLVCMDNTSDNRIVLLLLDDFRTQHANRSILEFASCLLAFKSAIDEAGGILDPWPNDRINKLISDLTLNDPSIEEGGFWIEQCHFLA